MRVRSWLIRGLILAGLAGLAALAWLANSWVSPERVREKVIEAMSEQFEDVEVHVGSARMRILGGIAVTDLRLTRRGDPPDQPFLVVPSAILYHDKEQLNRGLLVIRKVELENPTLRIERNADGKWNVEEIVKAGPADKPVPTFIVKGGTVTVIDRAPGALPPVTLSDVQLTLLNDPLPMLTMQAQAAAKGYGAVSVRGRLNRINRHLSLSVELAEFPLGQNAVPLSQQFAPELAPHLAKLTATANIKAEMTYAPDANPAWRHDVRVEVKDARFEHPDLPKPVEKIAATIRSVDGRLKVEDATAQIGSATMRLSLETRTDAPAAVSSPTDDPLRRFEDRLQRLDVSLSNVPLDDDVFKQLPESMKKARRKFNPTGQVDLGYKFTREAAGWKRELEVRPKQAGMMYEKFRYPVADVRGLIKRTVTHTGSESTTVDLVGTAAGQLITLKGRVDGIGDDPAMNLRITGHNVPLDEQLHAALPAKYAEIVRQFRASGRGDFVAEITQHASLNLTEYEFRVDVKDGKLNYTKFPYPVEKLKGRLVVRTTMTDPTRPLRPGEPIRPLPDRDEIIFDDFSAVHAGASVWMTGARRSMPDGRDRKLILHVGGNNVPIDADMKSALGAVKVENLWTNFAPRGKVTFAADIELIDRAPPIDKPDSNPPLDPINDVKLTLRFSGPSVTPKFFAYDLDELSGWLEYKNGRVDLAHIAAQHGQSRVKLAAGEVRFFADGSVWANLGGIEMKPFIPDEALRKALPGKLGSGLAELQLKGGAELLVKHMVILTPPDAQKPNPPVPFPSQREGGVKPIGPTPQPPPYREGEKDKLASGSPLPAGGVGGRGVGSSTPDPIVYWDAELKLFGAALDTGVAWEDVFGSIACRGRYEGTHLGAIRGNVWLDRAIVSRMPVTTARCQVRADPQQPDPARPGQYLPPTMQFLSVTGDLFHGVVGGEARVVLTDQTRYVVWLTVTGAQLEEVARHYKLSSDADLKGIAQAQLLVFNKLDPKTGRLVVEGEGNIDVPTGRMYNLPILLDLVKVLKLQAPDKTAFEQGHAVFRIHGDRIKVDQLDLIGKAVCLGGSGELDMSGEYVKFEFYTVWSQVLKQMINTPVGDVTAFLSKNLFTIKLTRENGELKYKPEPVPLITEPTKAVIERLKRGAGKIMGK
ncbi:MAG: DUF748 domain-containing protein [Planctomycetia bacterium]|nr:DUF748 domain-containing protein [Planctomycetia bacterium]